MKTSAIHIREVPESIVSAAKGEAGFAGLTLKEFVIQAVQRETRLYRQSRENQSARKGGKGQK